MNRWQAITEIAKSFNDKDRPYAALAALIILTAVPIALAALAYAAGINVQHVLMR